MNILNIIQNNSIWEISGFRKYFFNTGWLFFSRISSLFVAFIVNIFVIRYFGPADYGVLSYAISFVGLFSFFTSLGLDSILYRELVKYPQKNNILLGTAFFMRLAGSTLAMLFIMGSLFFIKESSIFNLIVSIIALSLLLQPFWVINYYFQSKVFSKPVTLMSFIVVLLLAAFKIIMIYSGVSIGWFSIFLLIEQFFYAIGFVSMYYKYGQSIFAWKYDKSVAKKFLQDSWPLLFTSAFAFIYTRVDQVMLGNFLDSTSVGIYDVGVRIAEFWYFIPGAIVSSLFPAIINSKKSDIAFYKKRISTLYFFIFWLSVLASLPLYLFADKIIYFLYGDLFMNSADVLKIYVWAGIGMSLSVVAQNWLVAENYTKIVFYITFLTAVLNIILNIILIPKYGVVGASFSTLIAYSCFVIFLLFFSKTANHVKLIFNSIFLNKKL